MLLLRQISFDVTTVLLLIPFADQIRFEMYQELPRDRKAVECLCKAKYPVKLKEKAS